MRKILSIILVLSLLISSMTNILVYADDVSTGASITIEDSYSFPGGIVDVEIVLNNNPGIYNLFTSFEFDNDVLKLVKVSNGTAMGNVDAFTPPKNMASGCSASWYYIDEPDTYKNGSLVVLTFEVMDTATAGQSYSVSVTNVTAEDVDATELDITVKNGEVKVIDYIPGDVNSDGIHTIRKDVSEFNQYIVDGCKYDPLGYGIQINEDAGDVNDDDKLNIRDVILVNKYIVDGCKYDPDGYAVKLLPHTPRCQHTDLTAVPAKEATCTEDGNIEYWTCDDCGKYFEDEEAAKEIAFEDAVVNAKHTLVNVSAKEATETETGNVEYWNCSKCGKLFSDENGKVETRAEDVVIPVVTRSEYSIQYVYKMEPQNVASLKTTDTYSPSQTKVLEAPILDKYKFLGWSDKEGNMYGIEIPKGTTGDLVLYANWASDRNRAVPVKQLGDPIICEDSDAGLILFVYEIGSIKNVPIFEKYNILSANGIITKGTKKTQTTIGQTNAESISKSIAQTTTNSTAWTLSKEWEENTSVSEEWAEEMGMTTEEAAEYSKSNSNTYNLTNSAGGSSSFTQTDGSVFKVTGNQSHSDTETNEVEKYTKYNIDGKLSNSTTTSLGLSAGINAGLEVPLKGGAKGNIGAEAGVEAGISNTFAWEIGAGTETGTTTKDVSTGTDSWSNTIDITNSSTSASTQEKTWNTSAGFSASVETSATETVSQAVSSLISNKNSKDSSYTTGGSNGESQEYASSNATNDECGSSVTYSTEQIESNEITIETTANVHGGYRIVHAGTAKVFGVVGYDIKNKAYFTYTHSILDDDEYKEYLDYSYDATFNDFETSVLPFEIPIFVNDYVNSRTATAELQVSDDGIVTAYLGSEKDEVVLIPSYYTRENTVTGEPEMVKIVGIKEGLFKNNTNIIGVSLGNFVNEIPKSAFEGCTNLKEIICPNVTVIGDYAFKDCSSLNEFLLPNEIESIGLDAFDGVGSIKVNAPTKEIAQIVASSNISNITLDISKIDEDDFSDMPLNVGKIDTFKLLGGRKEYSGLTIVSNADKTVISGVNIPECDGVPLDVSSCTLTLERVELIGSGWALVLSADDAVIELEGVTKLSSNSDNAAITKNVEFVQLNAQTYSAIETEKMVLVCGELTNNDGYLDEDHITYLSPDDFNTYLSTRTITFDANGGNVDVTEKTVKYLEAYGELPVPTRDYHTFKGWYNGDTLVSEDTIFDVTENITLWADWELKPVSGPVLASQVPSGAQIIEDTKYYSYDLTTYTTSDKSSLSGWTKYDTTWVWSNYGSWSAWQYGAVTETDSRDVETQQVVDVPAHTEYRYGAYVRYNNELKHRACLFNAGYGISGENNGPVKEIWTDWSDQQLPCSKHSVKCYHTDTSSACKVRPYESYGEWGDFGYGYALYYNLYGEAGVYDTDNHNAYYWEQSRQVDATYKTQYRYRDRSKIYTYHFKKVENLEAESYPSGNNISNIQEWVQYREK